MSFGRHFFPQNPFKLSKERDKHPRLPSHFEDQLVFRFSDACPMSPLGDIRPIPVPPTNPKKDL